MFLLFALFWGAVCFANMDGTAYTIISIILASVACGLWSKHYFDFKLLETKVEHLELKQRSKAVQRNEQNKRINNNNSDC